MFIKPNSGEKRDGKIVLDETSSLPDQLDIKGVEDLVSEFLENQKLQIFPEKMLTEAVRDFVDKDEKDAIKDFITKSLGVTREYLAKTVDEVGEKDDLAPEVDFLDIVFSFVLFYFLKNNLIQP